MPHRGFSGFVIVCCIFGLLITPAYAESYRQYDPEKLDEMYKSGLLEPVSKEQYEKEMASLNASTNRTLGCDDYPRCNPDMPVNSLPLSPLAVLAALGTVGFLVQIIRSPRR